MATALVRAARGVRPTRVACPGSVVRATAAGGRHARDRGERRAWFGVGAAGGGLL